jgi:hypothetical protein
MTFLQTFAACLLAGLVIGGAFIAVVFGPLCRLYERLPLPKPIESKLLDRVDALFQSLLGKREEDEQDAEDLGRNVVFVEKDGRRIDFDKPVSIYQAMTALSKAKSEETQH